MIPKLEVLGIDPDPSDVIRTLFIHIYFRFWFRPIDCEPLGEIVPMKIKVLIPVQKDYF